MYSTIDVCYLVMLTTSKDMVNYSTPLQIFTHLCFIQSKVVNHFTRKLAVSNDRRCDTGTKVMYPAQHRNTNDPLSYWIHRFTNRNRTIERRISLRAGRKCPNRDLCKACIFICLPRNGSTMQLCEISRRRQEDRCRQCGWRKLVSAINYDPDDSCPLLRGTDWASGGIRRHHQGNINNTFAARGSNFLPKGLQLQFRADVV